MKLTLSLTWIYAGHIGKVSRGFYQFSIAANYARKASYILREVPAGPINPFKPFNKFRDSQTQCASHHLGLG